MFVGEYDIIVYGENFGSIIVDIVGILEKIKEEL